MHVTTGHRGDTPMPASRTKRAKDPRSPFVGLIALLVFALAATFFAWFSAPPLWLTLGHGHTGVATVARCPVAGVNVRCAEFVADRSAFTAQVTLLGPASVHASSGTRMVARMVSKSDSTAYAGDSASLYLRWASGLFIVLLCGLGIAWSTGTFRLPSRRSRWITLAASIGAPLVLVIGMLAATW